MILGDYGEIGAILVENEHRNDIYLKHIVLNGLPNGPINEFNWVHVWGLSLVGLRRGSFSPPRFATIISKMALSVL